MIANAVEDSNNNQTIHAKSVFKEKQKNQRPENKGIPAMWKQRKNTFARRSNKPIIG